MSFVRLKDGKETNIRHRWYTKGIILNMTSTTAQTNKHQPTHQPVRKVVLGGVTGALVTLIVASLNTYYPAFENKPISGEISGAATTVLTFIVSYLIPPGRQEMVAIEEGVTKSAKR